MDLITKTETEKAALKQRNYKINKSNELITLARNNMGLREQRLLLLLISKIQRGDTPDTEYTISLSEISNITGCKQNHTAIKRITVNLNRSFWMKNLKGDGEDWMLSFFHTAKYNPGQATIRFIFHSEMCEYLFELKDHFTRYPLQYILPMRSSYSVKLYEYLKCRYQEQPQRTQWSFSLDDLQKYLGTKYAAWNNFRQKVLEPALGEINSKGGEINLHSDLNVSYRTEKHGRAVKFVEFHVTKKSDDEMISIKEKNNWIIDKEYIRPSDIKPYIPGQICMEDCFRDSEE